MLQLSAWPVTRLTGATSFHKGTGTEDCRAPLRVQESPGAQGLLRSVARTLAASNSAARLCSRFSPELTAPSSCATRAQATVSVLSVIAGAAAHKRAAERQRARASEPAAHLGDQALELALLPRKLVARGLQPPLLLHGLVALLHQQLPRPATQPQSCRLGQVSALPHRNRTSAVTPVTAVGSRAVGALCQRRGVLQRGAVARRTRRCNPLSPHNQALRAHKRPSVPQASTGCTSCIYTCCAPCAPPASPALAGTQNSLCCRQQHTAPPPPCGPRSAGDGDSQRRRLAVRARKGGSSLCCTALSL